MGNEKSDLEFDLPLCVNTSPGILRRAELTAFQSFYLEEVIFRSCLLPWQMLTFICRNGLQSAAFPVFEKFEPISLRASPPNS